MRVPKKVLYLLPSWFTFYYGFRGQLAYLKSKGFSIDVACGDDPRAVEAALREGVRYHKINFNTKSYFCIKNIFSVLCLIRLMKENKYSILFCTTKMAGFIGVITARITGVNWAIYGVCGIFAQNLNSIKRLLFPMIDWFICRASDHVVFISKSNMDYFLSQKICPRRKAVLFGSGSINGIDLDHFKRTVLILKESIELRMKVGIADNAFVFGFVGRLVKEKGIRELAGAWTMLKQDFNNVHLVIMSPPEIDASVVDCIAVLNKDENVHFLGFLENPVIGYSLLNCLLLPTYGEGLGNVILEAAAMEVPVIASRVLGCIDAVVQEETGLLIEPKNARALYLAMKRAIEEKVVMHSWGKNARERCMVLFDQKRVWKEYEDFYNRLLYKSQAPN